jgi:hypothetical protein
MMPRLTLLACGAVLLLGLGACTEDLTTPGTCPQTCPGGSVEIRDTVLVALLDQDSAYAGYVLPGQGTGLLVSTPDSADQYLSVMKFGGRPDSIRVKDSLYTYTIDSVAISIAVLARDPNATGIVLQLYRAPATVDSTVTYSDLAGLATPGNLLDSLVVPDTLENGNLRAVFSGADLAKVAIPASDSGVLAIAIGVTAMAPTGVELGSPTASTFLPTMTTYATVTQVDSANQAQTILRVPTFATFREENEPLPDPTILRVGGAPSSRILLHFSLPPELRKSATQILRAELILTPSEPIEGVTGIATTITARGLLTDVGAKSPLVPFLAPFTSIYPDSTSSSTIEVIDIVKTWQAATNPPAEAFFVSLQPEGSSFTRPVFSSSRSPTGAPQLRITYVTPLDFQEP